MIVRNSTFRDPRSGKTTNPPLFSGSVEFEYLRDNKGIGFHATLKLSLNLLGFIRHQPVLDKQPMSKVFSRKTKLRRREKRPSYEDEFAYDSSDNWLPDTQHWRAFANPDRCWSLFENYTEAISDRFQRHVDNAARMVKAFWHREEYFTIKKVECVWETFSDSPISEALNIGNVLFRNAGPWAKVKVNSYDDCPGVIRQANSIRVAIPLAGSVELRVYAKTNKRVRFEVVLDNLADARSGLRKEAGLPREERRQRMELRERSMSELLPMAKVIRARAAKHLNHLMERVGSYEGEKEHSLSGLDFLAEICGAISLLAGHDEKVSLANDLLITLIIQGGWRGPIPDGNLGRALQLLKQRGVLKGERGRKHLSVSPKYSNALASLRQLSPEALQTLLGNRIGES